MVQSMIQNPINSATGPVLQLLTSLTVVQNSMGIRATEEKSVSKLHEGWVFVTPTENPDPTGKKRKDVQG